jgi:tRNA(fMet)-specific endonuclease VapC
MLDTDTCIAIIKRQPEGAIRKLRGKSLGQVGVSAITVSELSYGTVRSARPAQNRLALQEFLLALELAPYDYAAALVYGQVRRALESGGTSIGSMDTLIAAHALATDSILVTHNVREFARVAGLRLEDWVGNAGGSREG